ncbi:MAG: NAD-dependent epimerase/dehydratase family protein [Desulfurococcales archaeon]|nr:NAD-dependent epimerase/dehydratase family protein [Desulfurococcales archaeon]
MCGKVVVTGGAGFIGSHLVDRLVEEGVEEIVVIDNFSSGSLKNLERHRGKKYLRIINEDLKNWGSSWINEFDGAEIVFHYAANPEVRVAATNPRIHFEENLKATFNVLEAARLMDVKYHVFASSSTVYGDAKTIPTPEDYQPLEPISVYGSVKLGAEYLYITYSLLYGFRSLILRYANIVGPRSNHGVIIDFIRKLRRNPRELEILGDGSQKKSYLYISDTVDATLHLFKVFKKTSEPYQIYNVGNEDWVSVIEIADIVVKEMGLKNVKYIFKPMTPDGRGWPGDVKLMLLDITKLKKTGWKPRYSSREAVAETARAIIKQGIMEA